MASPSPLKDDVTRKNHRRDRERSRSRSPRDSHRRTKRYHRRSSRSHSPRYRRRYSRSRSKVRSQSYDKVPLRYNSRSPFSSRQKRRRRYDDRDSRSRSRRGRRNYSPNRRRKGRSRGSSSSNGYFRQDLNVRGRSHSRRGNRDRYYSKRDDRKKYPSYRDGYYQDANLDRENNYNRERDLSFGVVSDDEDKVRDRKYKMSHKSHRKRSRSYREKRRRRRRRSKDDDYKRDRKYTSSDGSASSRDDSYGHFEGGKGTVIGGRYKIVKDVGLGTFGRVVQAIDLDKTDRSKYEPKQRSRHEKTRLEDTVAIKIVRRVKRYHESALIEADILRDVNNRGGKGRSLCAIMLRQFEFDGHCCLVFECLGRSLYDFMKTHGYKPFPLYCVLDFARQLLDALEFIHSFGLIHTDLKPENILLKSNRERSYRTSDGSDQQVPESTSIKLIDFGGATYDTDKKSSIINTRQYRSPEVILGLGWSTPSDLWSAGCIIAELYKGDLLFPTHDNVEHLALIERAIGPFPLDMLSKSKTYGDAFDSEGLHRLQLPLESQEHVHKMKRLENIFKDDQSTSLVNLLRELLKIDPSMRVTAHDALRSSAFE
jgi:dual specificity protein kinase CLK2/3